MKRSTMQPMISDYEDTGNLKLVLDVTGPGNLYEVALQSADVGHVVGCTIIIDGITFEWMPWEHLPLGFLASLLGSFVNAIDSLHYPPVIDIPFSTSLQVYVTGDQGQPGSHQNIFITYGLEL